MTTPPDAPIHVGFTESHGMASEAGKFPPAGVRYSFPEVIPATRRWIRSPIKGYMRNYAFTDEDVIEAIISPVRTDRRWILSIANFQEAVAFNFMGLPTPRPLRVAYIKHLLLKDNCKKVVFWSHAGKKTLTTYGKVTDPRLHAKADVVYPAIRKAQDQLITYSDRVQDVNLLFSGYFFRKGGVNVIDAFERAQKIYPNIKLRLCCGENIDFTTDNHAMRDEYLQKIRSNPGIIMARADREELINVILPNTDIFLVPTYVETFGFAILEAMAYGLPIISTTYFAIPEMIEHGVSGLLIDTDRFDCDQLFRGYIVNHLPPDFREHMTETLFEHMCKLIESPALRRQLGTAAMHTARTRFSFETRNEKMLAIYKEAVR